MPHSERVAPTVDAIDLAFIPRAVRNKLDRVAIKLHWREWQALTLEERRELYEMPCTGSEEISTFRVRLDALIWQRCGQRLKSSLQLSEKEEETWRAGESGRVIQT
jgi:hypothetical protein